MVSPLEGSLARTIGRAMNSLFLDAVLTRDVPGTITDPADPSAPTTTDYTCKVVVEKYNDYFTKNELVQAGDRRVLILALSLATRPQANDRVTVSGITFTLSNIGTDPATAVWECTGSM